MSRNFVVVGRAAAQNSPGFHAPLRPHEEPASPSGEPVVKPGQYADLIRHLFRGPAAIAIIGRHPIVPATIAAEIGASGRLALIVDVRRLLLTNPIRVPGQTDFAPGAQPNVWVWPAPATQKLEFFKPRETSESGDWLTSLRRHFDSIVLDCQNIEGSPGVTEIAAMADAAVLAVEAGRTSKQQLQQDHQALRLRGARIAGSILIRRS